MRKFPENITKELLENLYIIQGLSRREVSNVLGKSTTQVSRYLKRFGITARPFSTKGLKPRLGAILSEKTKEKIRKKALGKVTPLEVRKKMGSKGRKNPGWLHGKYPMNKRIRNSFEYRVWREQVFQRDDYTCQMCGRRGGDLHADHIVPFAINELLRFELSNGRVLCKDCHRKTPTYGTKTLLLLKGQLETNRSFSELIGERTE